MSEHTDNFLIIDDDETLTMVLQRALKRRSFNAHTASNGKDALALCEELQPQYISLDLKMVEETGLHLIPKLLDVSPRSRIVMLTAYGSISTAVDAIKAGAFQYLCKPVDADQLLEAFASEKSEPVKITEEKAPSVKRLEWEYIQQALNNNDGNVSATARELGMHRRTLQRKLQKHPVRE